MGRCECVRIGGRSTSGPVAVKYRDGASLLDMGLQLQRGRWTTPLDLGGPISTETRINDRIRVPEVRLIGPGGEQVGIVRVEDALRVAMEADLDLVEVAPDAKPPVCK